MSKTRLCVSCGKPLSAYNDDDICQSCPVNPNEVKKALKEIKSIARGKGEL
jgi:NMD protein affecting ribosome stability and mRNA decay